MNYVSRQLAPVILCISVLHLGPGVRDGWMGYLCGKRVHFEKLQAGII